MASDRRPRGRSWPLTEAASDRTLAASSVRLVTPRPRTLGACVGVRPLGLPGARPGRGTVTCAGPGTVTVSIMMPLSGCIKVLE